MSCINAELEPWSQVFDRIKVCWLRRLFQNVHLWRIRPFSHHISLVLKVVVMLKLLPPSKSKLPWINLQVFFESFIIIFLSHNSFYTVKRTYLHLTQKNSAITLSIHHHASLGILFFGQLASLFFLKTYFTSFWPKNSIFVSSDQETCLQNMLSLSAYSMVNFIRA